MAQKGKICYHTWQELWNGALRSSDSQHEGLTVFPLCCFARFRVLAFPKLTVLMTQNCQWNFVACWWPHLQAERRLFCISLYRSKKTFFKCTSSWLPLIVLASSSGEHQFQTQPLARAIGFMWSQDSPSLGREGPSISWSTVLALSYLEKIAVFLAREKGGNGCWVGGLVLFPD